ncbi:MAG TPA: Rieske (2Fe-2S) protein [Gemmatimonadaceae bacterium]|jgi:Rieske Fe-S protein
MSNKTTHAATTAEECGGCPLHDAVQAPAAIERRAFLRAAGMAMASLGLLGVGSSAAAAMPIRSISALATSGDGAKSEKHYPLPGSDGVSIDRDNSAIIARANGKIYAFSLSCPHQNTALRWDGDDHQFQCPKHHSRYKDDGTFISGRATRNMDRLPIRKAGNELIVDVDTMYRQDEDPAAWAAAFVTA